jgi:ribose transport system ATP-binding protein
VTTPSLQVENATKNFPGVKALDSVSLDLQPGEIHALLGENGAGKSTLIKIITGVYRPDKGDLQIAGEPVNFTSPQQALSAGIGTVHQERNLIPHYSIAENIMLDRLPTKFGLIDRNYMRQQAKHWLGVLDLHIDPDLPVRRLSVAQMQLVEIARALSMQSRILLLDEPTVGIDIRTKGYLHRLIWNLAEQGAAVLLISSDMPEMVLLADRVVVMKDMQIVGDLPNSRQYEGMPRQIMHCKN